MNWKTANELAAEVAVMAARNTENAVRSAGDAAQYMLAANKPGYDVVQPNTNELAAFAGIWLQVVSRSSTGLIQTYGYNATVAVGLSSVVAGDPLKPAAGVDYLVPCIIGKSAPGQNADYDSFYCFAVSMEANATTAEATKAALIRAC